MTWSVLFHFMKLPSSADRFDSSWPAKRRTVKKVLKAPRPSSQLLKPSQRTTPVQNSAAMMSQCQAEKRSSWKFEFVIKMFSLFK